MERVILPAGTLVNLPTFFEDLQDYTQTNAKRIVDLVFSSYGINAEVTPAGLPTASDISMKPSLSGNTVQVLGGEAITSGLNYINIPPKTFSLGELPADGSHSLYVIWQPSYDTPVAVANGFYYQAGTNYQNSRAHDNYVYSWDYGVCSSGILIADVVISGGLAVSVVDKRYTNILTLSNAILSKEIVRTNQTALQRLSS